MKKIFKYPFGNLIHGRAVIAMPSNADVLSVGAQNDQIVVWALVDESAETFGRLFLICWTGIEVDVQKSKYIGTVQIGTIVCHVFDEGFIESI